MRYFIGFYLDGESGEWHRSVTSRIAKRFDVEDQDKRIPPHITIIPPFASDDKRIVVEEVRKFLSDKRLSGEFVLSGFGRFGEKVIFADVKANEEVEKFVKEFQDFMAKFKTVSTLYPEWKSHATIASKLPSAQMENIWEYVSILPGYEFKVPLNNLTLFRYLGDRKWEIDEHVKI